MTKPFSEALMAITESAPLAVSTKAQAMRAEGRDVIAFGAGEPDSPTPPEIVEAARAALLDESNHHYSPPGGHMDLRELIAAHTTTRSGRESDAMDVVVSNGGKQAVFNALAAVINPGDEVLLPTPYWTTYPELIRLTGGTPVTVFADASQGFKVTVEQLEEATTKNTKALIFTSPSNPTGAVYESDEVKAIAAWAERRGIWVISDEMYQDFVYDGLRFVSPGEHMSAERLIIVSGLSKNFVLTGWRLGWVVGPRSVAKLATNFQSHTTGNVSNVSQRAGVAAFHSDWQFPRDLAASLDRRREIALDALGGISGIRLARPQGAFYIYADVNGLLDGSLVANGSPIRTSAELASWLLERAEVAIVPGEAFGPSGYLRISYALDEASLVEGINRIKSAVTGTER